MSRRVRKGAPVIALMLAVTTLFSTPALAAEPVVQQEEETVPAGEDVKEAEKTTEMQEPVSETTDEAVPEPETVIPAGQESEKGSENDPADTVKEEEDVIEEIPEETAEPEEEAEALIFSGPYEKDGRMYYRAEDGSDMTGWIAAGDDWYYAGPDGILKTGLQTIKKKQYYLDPETYVMATGAVNVSGKWYFFDTKSGARKMNGGWCTDKAGNKFYADKKGILKSGWQTISKKKYYLCPDTRAMAKGAMKISGKWYFFDEKTGAVKTSSGWYADADGNKYYAGKKGVLQTGWQKIKKKWYYFDPATAKAVSGFITLSGKTYYLDPSTFIMKTGAFTDAETGISYLAESSGALASGFKTIGGKKYYYHPDYHRQEEGEAVINGFTCRFGADGALISGLPSGWVEKDGSKYYYDKDGNVYTGEKKVDGKTYVFGKNGEMLTGMQISGGKIYALKDDGSAVDKYTKSAKLFSRLSDAQKKDALRYLSMVLLDTELGDFANVTGTKEEVRAAWIYWQDIMDVINNTYCLYQYKNAHCETAKYDIKDESGKAIGTRFTMTKDRLEAAKKFIQSSQDLENYIESALKKSGAMSKKSIKDKVKAIDNYICKTMTYNYKYNGAVSSGIRAGKGSCNEYACYFYFMCQKAGIPCRYVYGYANGGKDPHAWNSVKISGKWYYIDTCWNDSGSKSSRRYYLSAKEMKGHKSRFVIKSTEWEMQSL